MLIVSVIDLSTVGNLRIRSLLMNYVIGKNKLFEVRTNIILVQYLPLKFS